MPRRVVVSLLGLVVLLALALQSTQASGAGAPVYPNIVEQVPSHLAIQNTQQREFLRFTTVHINFGPGNLQIRGGGQVAPCVLEGVSYEQCTIATQELLDSNGVVTQTHPAGAAVFHPEHNHWHMSAVAEFKILKGHPVTGTEAAKGLKVTFCLVDVEFTGLTGAGKKAQPRTYWECNGDLQGIAAGWGDSYHQSTEGQELEVTGLPAGDYYLTNEADPNNQWLEASSSTAPQEKDNLSWVKFRLSRKGANPEITILSHSPCTGVQCEYGGNP